MDVHHNRPLTSTLAAFAGLAASSAATAASPPKDRIAAGEPIRIGCANELPFTYPGENGELLGFINAHTLGMLAAMGYTDMKPVQTDWGGLIASGTWVTIADSCQR